MARWKAKSLIILTASFLSPSLTHYSDDQLALQPKRPHDSLIEKVLPFSGDKKLQSDFVNSFGKIRIGLILEELDTLAGFFFLLHLAFFLLNHSGS